MITLSLIVLLITAAVFAADRLAFLREHQIRLGILFGILAIVANTFSADVYNMGISVGLIDVPPMIAGLMFGPTAGILAGFIAAAERALTPLWGVGATTWGVCSSATLFVSLYAAAFRNFVFDYQRPTMISGMVTVAFGEVLHLAFFFLNRMDDLSLTCEVIYASAEPMILGSAAAMMLSCLVCWRRGQKKQAGLNAPVRSLLVFSIAFVILVRIALAGAETQVDEELNDAVVRFDQRMSRTIELFMFRCTDHVMACIEDPLDCSPEILKRGAKEHGLDEVNIITPDEKIIVSNRDDLTGTTFPRSNAYASEFYKLFDDSEIVVKQGFRTSLSKSTEYSRYLGIAFPKRNAILEVGYSFERLEKELDRFFLPFIADLPIYRTGYFLAVDENGVIVNDVRGHHEIKGRKITDLGLSASHLHKEEKKMFYDRIMGDISRCVVDRKVGKMRLIAVLPLKDVYWPVLRLVFICGFALFCLSLLFRWTIVKAARNQRMLDELRKKHEAQKEKELVLARSIQASELRMQPFTSDQCEIHAIIHPAREVGGDSYDYFRLPDGTVVFGIADVSGKGISAAIFMMKVKTTMRLLSVQDKTFAEYMDHTNNILCQNNDNMMFVTSWGGSYNPVTQELEYICAGHNPPLIVRANGSVMVLDCIKALPLGVRPDYHYHVQKIHLEHGDRVFLYTDGVTEAMNTNRQLYGMNRLQSLLEKYSRDSKANLIEQVRWSVKEFAGEAEQADDITMLVMSVK